MKAILDTGVLVAYLNRDDPYHEWATQELKRVRIPALTCEAVISETCFLLERNIEGKRSVLELITRGVLQIGFDLGSEAENVRNLMVKYADVPMGFADGCLVRMSEIHIESVIITIDGDFRVYRRNKRQSIAVIMP